MKQAERKDFFREIGKSRGRFLSLLFIVALGVAFFAGIRSSEPSMRITGDAYFDEHHLMDAKVVSTLGLTEDDVLAVGQVDGVERAVGSYSQDFLSVEEENQKVLHVMAQVEDMNESEVADGRMPQKPGECLADQELGYQVGDVIGLTTGTDDAVKDSFKTETLTVVGVGSNPCYISYNRGSTNIGTGSIDGFLVVTEDSFDLDYFTEIYVLMAGAEELTAYTDAYEDTVQKVLDGIEEISDGRCEIRRAELVGDAEDEVADAEAELADARKEAEDELADAEKELNDAEAELADGEAELQDGRDQINAARKELNDAQGEIDEGWSEYNDGYAQYQSGKDEYDAGRSEYKEGKAAYEDAKAEAEPELNAARQELEGAKEQIDDLQTLYDGMNELTAQINSVKSALDKAASSGDSVSAGELQTQLAMLQAQLNQMEQTYGTAEEVKATLDAAQKEYDKGEAEYEAGEKELADAKAELDSAKAELDAAKAELDDAKAELDAARAQLESGQAEIDEGWAEIAEQEETLAEAEAEIEEARAEIEDGWEEYDKNKEEVDKELADAQKKIDDAKKEIEEIQEAEWYVYDRGTLPEYTGYGDNADRMRAIGQVFPVIFFLVAALMALTSMTRMVEEQRVQIGTMKALGYSRFSTALKYLGYAFLATAGGSIIGVLLGEKLLPYTIIYAYDIMYPAMGSIHVPYHLSYAVEATAAALICTLGATFASCYSALRAQPAQLMRPPSPKSGKRVFLERVKIIWGHLNFSWKSTVRNLFRYKRRFFMTVAGIGGCMGLMIVGFGLRDSIFEIGQLQYTDIQVYQETVYLDDDLTREEEEDFCAYLDDDPDVTQYMKNYMMTVTLMNGRNEREAVLDVLGDPEAAEDYVHFRDRVTGEKYTITDDGAMISEKTAKLLNVGVGDSVYIKDEEKGNVEVKIASIFENYMSHYMYITPAYYREIYGEEPEYNCMLVENPRDYTEEEIDEAGARILAQDQALTVTYMHDVQKELDDMLVSLNLVIIVLIISAGMLAFVVLYNLNSINITERTRELATLKVLGFTDMEVAMYVYRENILLTVVGAIFGAILGTGLHRFVIQTVEVDAVMFGRVIFPSSYLYSVLFTILFSIIVNFIMYFKLKKIDMVESLKSVE